MLTHSNEPALEDVFIANRAHLWRIARKIVRTADLADDIVQDAYLRVADSPLDRRVERPLSYCNQIVRNLALDHCRRRSREADYRNFDVDVETLEIRGAPSVERTAMERELLRSIAAKLAELPPRPQRAFALHRFEGLTQREVASRMGYALGMVNAWIAEACRAIDSCGDIDVI